MKDWSYEPAKDHEVPAIERFRSPKREKGLVGTLTHLVTMAMVEGYFRVYNRMRVVHGERLPKASPFVICANHASHVDALVLASVLPGSARETAYAVAAGDVFFTTVTSSALASLLVNALPLWRKKITTHALEELRTRLLDGHTSLILFPEGARSRDGGPQKFKPGIGMIVAGTAIPVYPCYIDGAFEAMPPGKRVPRPKKITVTVGEPLRFEGTPNTREGWNAVAAALRESIGRMAPVAWKAEGEAAGAAAAGEG
jgi:1-acyl-sn-glycerol-3-phosphate acyltransferase